MVEEDKSDGKGGNIAQGEDEGFEVGGAQVAAVADFVSVKLSVEFPASKDADKHATERQEHCARKVVEEGENIAMEELNAGQWSKREGATEAQQEHREGDDEGTFVA